MRKIIDELLNGQVEAGNGTLDFSCSDIQIVIKKGEVFEGSFFVYSSSEKPIEGIVLSSELRMECKTEGFVGKNEEIMFRFRSEGMEECEESIGHFTLITNAGEYELPFHVRIESTVIVSSLGEIRNVFHFANLAKANWNEAVHIFYSKPFRKIFKEGSDKQYYSIYKGLSAVYGNQQNVEEFLLQMNKKQSVEYKPDQDSVTIEDPYGVSAHTILLTRSGWGYTFLQVEVQGDFLKVEKSIITDDGFLNNQLFLSYEVDSALLHGGNNYGCIRFISPYQTLTVPITVIRHLERKRAYGIRKEKQKITVQLIEYYEAFRTKRISGRIWMSETNRLVERICSLDNKDVETQLFRVQLLLTEERKQEGKWLLDKIGSRLDGEKPLPHIACYFLYLLTLYGGPEKDNRMAVSKAQILLRDNPDNWRIAWLVMHMSEEYTKSPTKKWLLLNDQFQRGSTSPVLYTEAWHLMEHNPTLLMKLSGFEVQVLHFAAKRALLTQDVIIQFIYLVSKQKEYLESLFSILKECYQLYPNKDTLQAICILLMKGNKTTAKYFPWYQMGVEQELRITKLYEYYMISLPEDFKEELPKMILMYFSYHTELDYHKSSFLFSYVYKHKDTQPEMYISYCEKMERFVLDQISKNRINKNLAYLYENTVTPRMITKEVARQLAELLFIHEVTVLKENIVFVTVSYAISREEHKYLVVDGKTKVPIYGSDYQILLEDKVGNRYCGANSFSVEKLVRRGRMIPLVAPYVKEHMGMDVFLCEENKTFLAIQENNAVRFRNIAASEHIEGEYRSEIRLKLIHYYYEKDYIRELDAYLEELRPEPMNEQERNEVLRFLVMRGQYDKGFLWLKRFGLQGVDSKTIVRLCSRMISRDGFVEEEALVHAIYHVFQKGKYDGNLIAYLVYYFNGTIQQMRDIWKAAVAFDIDTYELCERMIIQMLYTASYIGERMDLFKSYVAGGAKTVVEAKFLSHCAFDYFTKGSLIDDFVFLDSIRVYERGETLGKVCKLAFLKYYAENKGQIRGEMEVKYKKITKMFLTDILEENIYFPFFKEYVDELPVMEAFADKTMIEYRAQPGSTVRIHYFLEKGQGTGGEYQIEEMRDMYKGIYVKSFILFFGERVQYYITEENGEKKEVTQSASVGKSEPSMLTTEGRFAIINDIVTAKTMQDYATVDALTYEYYKKDFVTEQIFQLRE